ncbi:MAG: Aminotransferase class I/II-fold pyridoxal phosphate-dependent enzyme, partial [Chloroflexi bacterium]|nr:Aminotransferase class I/II-fold pyridoxal phosphate-dependent enzyme [Chloroflexota bacterium]
QIGRDHIRVSYANSQANIIEALARIRSVVQPIVAARG